MHSAAEQGKGQVLKYVLVCPLMIYSAVLATSSAHLQVVQRCLACKVRVRLE